MNPRCLVVLLLAACSSPVTPKVEQTPQGPALPVDHPPIDAEKTSRGINRISVAQLGGSLPQVFGNDLAGRPITWMVQVGGQQVQGLVAFGATIGAPDYINVTEENLEPSPLYLKFTQDLAVDTCDRALTADAGRTDKTTRALLRKIEPGSTVAAEVDENLKYLRLRFHGIKVTDDAEIASLRTLFTAVVAGGTTPAQLREGWRAVCVALLTAPEFHLY